MSVKPPLCGTNRCPCARAEYGAAFLRWDEAYTVSRTLEGRLMGIDELSAHTYADVLRVRSARGKVIGQIRRAVESEARVRGKDAAWVERECGRLIYG
jgi:hypothetical protein